MKRTAILQSAYIPWKGFFDIIAYVDEFVIYDDMQFTKRSWKSRNQIKTSSGLQWLTVPVMVKGRYDQAIRDTEIDGTEWAGHHWRTLELNYRRAPFFHDIATWLEPLYLGEPCQFLSQLNRRFIEAICGYLGIGTRITNSWDYELVGDRNERLVSICRQSGASEYVSGPAAKVYMDESLFQANGIQVTWFDYAGYAPYPQLWGDFVHEVSILDLLFNCGPQSRNYLKYVRP